MTYPYVASPDKLKSLLTKLAKEVGIPPKCDMKFLKTNGFTSSNDNRLLSAIKFIGLADEKGNPGELWKELRADSKLAVAKGVRQGYADLFSHFPDAHLKDDEALRLFFSAQTTLGAQAVAKMVTTFKAFREMGDFSAAQSGTPAKAKPAAQGAAEASKQPPVIDTPEIASEPSVNINVQLQVPPDATGEIYDKFFEAMRKHLWPPKK